VLTFFPWNLLPSNHNNFYDNSVLKTASFEDNDCDNSLLATLITIKDTFFQVYLQVFFTSLLWDLWNYFLRPHFSLFDRLHGHFTATYGYKISTANNFLKLPHLRNVAVTTATWQHWFKQLNNLTKAKN
jgi:hypothetical protein